ISGFIADYAAATVVFGGYQLGNMKSRIVPMRNPSATASSLSGALATAGLLTLGKRAMIHNTL
ncbi:MAG: hypothetical protein PHZ16_03330, partial [Eubacteriales bacterium]|nr:hypothetical protein [Eubacteriales bacterium]